MSARFIGFASLAGVVLAGGLAVPTRLISARDAPRISAACMDCHEGYDVGLNATAHRLPATGVDDANAGVTCTDCHLGDSRHWEEDPEEFAMPRFDQMHAVDMAQLCSSCHMNAHQQSMLEGNVHTRSDLNCGACHSVHASTRPELLKQEQVSLCVSCHRGVELDFARAFRHPLAGGVVTCSECHQTLDLTSTELSLNGSNMCMECHAEFHGPFPFEHQATLDYSTEGGGCLTCHEAHGSFLPRMLKQPYEAPQFQLCSQCHVVPLHNMNAQHGTTWAGVACSECHTDIHGSFVSRNFLNESLQTQGCFNAGCHQF